MPVEIKPVILEKEVDVLSLTKEEKRNLEHYKNLEKIRGENGVQNN